MLHISFNGDLFYNIIYICICIWQVWPYSEEHVLSSGATHYVLNCAAMDIVALAGAVARGGSSVGAAVQTSLAHTGAAWGKEVWCQGASAAPPSKSGKRSVASSWRCCGARWNPDCLTPLTQERSYPPFDFLSLSLSLFFFFHDCVMAVAQCMAVEVFRKSSTMASCVFPLHYASAPCPPWRYCTRARLDGQNFLDSKMYARCT